MEKQKISFRGISTIRLPLILLVLWSAFSIRNGHAQDMAAYYSYNDNQKIRDISVPTGYTYLYAVARGADGGKATSFSKNAGEGARVSFYIPIGTAAGELPAGSTLRLIPGQQGESTKNHGGGGGGTAIVFKGPGSGDSWQLLAVAGGGGGAGKHNSGMPATDQLNGISAKSFDGSSAKNGGQDGYGGKDPGAGGGSLGPGKVSSSQDAGFVGQAGWQNKTPTGGAGGNSGNYQIRGGFGFGGGGSGIVTTYVEGPDGAQFYFAGGGGGGYSGGGAGGPYSNNSGGGGGSYANPDWVTMESVSSNGTTADPQDGYVSYRFTNSTPIKVVRLAKDQTKCIDDYGAGTKNGTNIQLYHCHDHPAQQWFIEGSSIKLFKDLKKCIDLSNGNTSNGANIQLWDCQDGNRNQVWIYDAYYQAIRSGVDFNKCLDLTRSNTADETNIQLWDCNRTDAQKWIVSGLPSAPPAEAYQRLQLVKNPGKCVDINSSGTTNGTNIQLYQCNRSDAQHFIYDGRNLRMQAASNMCVDVNQSGTKNGTNVQLWNCNGTNAQLWIYDSFSQAFRSALNTNKCMDVNQSKVADGTNIQLWDCNGTEAQKFVLDYDDPCIDDTIPPVAKCKDFQNNGNIIPRAADFDAGSYDNCSVSSRKLESLGAGRYKLIVADPTGNSGYCQARVY